MGGTSPGTPARPTATPATHWWSRRLNQDCGTPGVQYLVDASQTCSKPMKHHQHTNTQTRFTPSHLKIEQAIKHHQHPTPHSPLNRTAIKHHLLSLDPDLDHACPPRESVHHDTLQCQRIGRNLCTRPRGHRVGGLRTVHWRALCGWRVPFQARLVWPRLVVLQRQVNLVPSVSA
jgi:hypothetical protein